MKLFNEKVGGLVIRDDKIEGDANYRYFVVSLPDKYFYTKILSFPLNLSKEEVGESVNLNGSLVLPLAPDKIYIDWEKVISLNLEKQEYSLFIGRKEIIDSYLDKLDKAGLRIVAVEPHILSFLRAADLSSEPALVLNLDGDNLSSAIIENKAVRFLRNSNFAPENLLEEVSRLLNFYKFNTIFTIGFNDELNKKISEEFSAQFVKSFESDILVLGAAKRGLISRTEDTAPNLMAIGTEETYANKKALAFSVFISNLIMGMSIFFILLFSGSYFFLLFLDKDVDVIPPEISQLETLAEDFNNRIALMLDLEKLNPQWSLLLKEIKQLNLPGITFNRFNVPGIDQILILQGTAKSQDELLQLKAILEKSPYFSNVKLPLHALTLKQDIGFSFTFNIKDQKWLLK